MSEMRSFTYLKIPAVYTPFPSAKLASSSCTVLTSEPYDSVLVRPFTAGDRDRDLADTRGLALSRPFLMKSPAYVFIVCFVLLLLRERSYSLSISSCLCLVSSIMRCLRDVTDLFRAEILD